MNEVSVKKVALQGQAEYRPVYAANDACSMLIGQGISCDIVRDRPFPPCRLGEIPAHYLGDLFRAIHQVNVRAHHPLNHLPEYRIVRATQNQCV